MNPYLEKCLCDCYPHGLFGQIDTATLNTKPAAFLLDTIHKAWAALVAEIRKLAK